MDICEQIVKQIWRADPDEGVRLVREWAETHGYEHVAEQVLMPVLKEFAIEINNSGGSPLARGYVAAKFAERTMDLIHQETMGRYQVPRRHVSIVLGNIEDDFHALGRKMVHTFLRSDGWDIIDLGNDVPAERFVDTAQETGARLIGVSAMMYSTAVNIKKVREEIDRRGCRNALRLAVGGAVFNLRPDLVQEVGGDGTAPSAIEVPRLFSDLYQQVAEEVKA